MREYQEKMLERGWIACRNIEGEIVAWQDPHEEKNRWQDYEVELFHQAGDGGHVPPLARGRTA